MSQLGLGLGLTRGGGVPFNPLSLDPYLLFDTRSSMIGTLENPTLDLDPSKPDTLNVITATRAGTATYTDANGVIQTASPDTVRVDHVDGVPMILVEPSATNLLPYSEDFSNAAWAKSNVTLTADYGIAPDGTNTSTRIEYPAGSSYIAESVTPATYTASAFVKGVSGEVVKFGVGANIGQGVEFTLNGQWQRIEHTGTGGTIFFSALGGNTATDFEIWGAQLETGSVATSYIPTSGGDAAARTRAADDLVISGSDFTDFFNGSEGTFYIEALHTRTLLDAAYISGQSSNQYFMYRNRTDNNLNSFDGGNFVYVSNIPSDALFRAAVTYSTTGKTLSMDGTTTAEGPQNSNWAATNILNIGQGLDGQMGGHIKRLIYWPYHSDSL